MIAYGTKAAEDYRAAGIPEDRVFVAHNAVANQEAEKFLNEFGQDLSWIRRWKADNGLDVDLPFVLFVGRLIPQKQVDLLIRACIPLFDRCQLVIVGDGPSRLDLESLAQAYAQRICFLGYKSGVDLAHCFIASDIFALPGSGGLAIHQAMSYGKPIIVSFGDGTELDLVRNGTNGLYVRPGDANTLTDKLQMLLDDDHLRRAMGHESLRIVRQEINLDTMVSSFTKAIASVAG
jgi:glycosyltransferase involved in cell wall biosynthesis